MFLDLIKVFQEYLQKASTSVLKNISACSKELSSTEVKVNLSGEKNEQKLTKSIDKLVDNVRIFCCFLADLTVYFYNLDSLSFTCLTVTGDLMEISQNPFLQCEVIANYFIDLIFREDNTTSIAEMIQFQSKDPNDLLLTNIAQLAKRSSWQEIGLPAELVKAESARHESFFTNSKEENKQQDQNESMMQDYFPDEQCLQGQAAASSQKQATDGMESAAGVAKGPIEPKFDATLGDISGFQDNFGGFEGDTIMFGEEVSKIRGLGLLNETLNLAPDCTAIPNAGVPFHIESSTNSSNANILGMLNFKDDSQTMRNMFAEAIEIFKEIPKARNPCRKLYLFSSTISCAMKQMRKMYSELSPAKETKVKIKIEVILSVLIFIIVRAGLPDLISEYKIMKVYFLLSKEYNHNKLVYLLKSAIKSINKLGVYLTKSHV